MLGTLGLIHALLLCLMLSRSLDPLFNDARHRLGPGTDFYAYYNAGKHWLAGEGAYGHGPGFGFRYHPGFAASVGAILSVLPMRLAFGTWVAVQEIAFLGTWFLLWIKIPSQRDFLFASVLLVFFMPYYLEAYMGNASFICAAILFGAFHFLKKRQRWHFLVVFSLSIILKPLGLIFLPLLLLRRHYVESALAVTLTGGIAAVFFAADPTSFNRFMRINLEPIHAQGWVIHAGNQGFHGLLTTIFARTSGVPTDTLSSFGDLPFAASFTLVFLPFTLVILSCFACKLCRCDLGIGMFLFSAAYLLGYKDVWEHSYSFVVLGLIYLYESRIVDLRLLAIVTILLAAPTAFALYDVPLPEGPIDPEHQWNATVSILHHATKSIPLLVLYGCAILACIRKFRLNTHGQDTCRILGIWT